MIVALAIAISLGGFALFLTSEIRQVNEREETAKLQSTNDLVRNMIAQTDAILQQQAENWANAFSAALSGNFSTEDAAGGPTLKLNGVPLNGHTREVDSFSNSGKGNVATIFARKGDDFVPIATSVKKEDGSRAIGTTLGKDHPAYARLMTGNSYVGKATLFGRPYMAKYEPVKDSGGQIVGVLFVGIDILTSLDYVKATIKE